MEDLRLYSLAENHRTRVTCFCPDHFFIHHAKHRNHSEAYGKILPYSKKWHRIDWPTCSVPLFVAMSLWWETCLHVLSCSSSRGHLRAYSCLLQHQSQRKMLFSGFRGWGLETHEDLCHCQYIYKSGASTKRCTNSLNLNMAFLHADYQATELYIPWRAFANELTTLLSSAYKKMPVHL